MIKKIVFSLSLILLFLCFQTLDAGSESGKENKKEQARETIRNQLELKNPFLEEEMRHQPREEKEGVDLDSPSKEKKTFFDKEKKEERKLTPKGREEDFDNPAVWGDLKNQNKKGKKY